MLLRGQKATATSAGRPGRSAAKRQPRHSTGTRSRRMWRGVAAAMTITHMVCLPICLHGMTLSHCPPLVGSLGAMHTFTLSHTPWRPQLVVAVAPSPRPAAGAAASPPPRLAAADRPTRSCQCSKNQIMQNFDGPGTIAPNPGQPCHPLSLLCLCLCLSAPSCCAATPFTANHAAARQENAPGGW